MAWEWVGPVAAASTGAVGVFFTWLSGKQGRTHAETVSNNQLANSRLLATEARQQQRLEAAYIQLLKEAERVGNWAQLAYPVLETIPPQPQPDLPSLDDQAETAALANAYGSDEVKERLEAWRKITLAMTVQARRIGMTTSGTDQNIDARMKLEDLRPKEKEARLFLASQVATELKATASLPAALDQRALHIPTGVGQDDLVDRAFRLSW